MFKLPKKMLFAIEAVIDIAYNAGGMPVQNNEITQRQGIPKRYLEQVLQKLVRSELLISIRGPGGGYKLARERRRITLGDICRVVKSPNLEKYQTKAGTGSQIDQKIIEPLWEELQIDLMKKLDTITIEDICMKSREQNIESKIEDNIDFSI